MKRIISLFLSLMIIGSMFAGCGKKADNAAAPANQSSQQSQTGQNTQEKVTISLGMWASSPEETALVDSQIKELEAAMPNIKIDRQVITDDFNQAIQARIASKNEPDVFYLDIYQAPNYISKNAILPLDEYLDKSDISDFQDVLIKAFQKDGKTYGLPKDYNTLALFYNKDMFEAAGIKNPPTTWEELEAAAKALTKNGVKGLCLPNDCARYIPFIVQAGGNITNGNDVAFNTPEAAQGLDFYYSMIKKGYAEVPKNLGVDWGGDALAKGKVAMVFEGGWLIPYMASAGPNIKYGIAPLPKGIKEGNLTFCAAYVMGRNTKHPKEAAEVIKFLTGKKALQLVAESGLAIPSRKSMGEIYTQKFPERKPLVDGAKYAIPYQFGEKSDKIVDVLNKAGEAIYMKQMKDAKSALEDAASKVK